MRWNESAGNRRPGNKRQSRKYYDELFGYILGLLIDPCVHSDRRTYEAAGDFGGEKFGILVGD